eukprot:2806996-Rhodomonas_salina.1
MHHLSSICHPSPIHQHINHPSPISPITYTSTHQSSITYITHHHQHTLQPSAISHHQGGRVLTPPKALPCAPRSISSSPAYLMLTTCAPHAFLVRKGRAMLGKYKKGLGTKGWSWYERVQSIGSMLQNLQYKLLNWQYKLTGAPPPPRQNPTRPCTHTR